MNITQINKVVNEYHGKKHKCIVTHVSADNKKTYTEFYNNIIQWYVGPNAWIDFVDCITIDKTLDDIDVLHVYIKRNNIW